MLTGNGLARRVHVALIGLLVLGVAGSFWMGLRARSTAEERAVEQAQVIADSSLTLVFRPDDLQHDASPERIRELSRSIDDVVLDPSDFETVTLFSGSGEILFSTEDGNIGQRLAGERQRVRAAFRGQPQARLVDHTLSVLVGLRFPSGVGSAAAVELSRPADDITGAAGPWRTNMFFLAGALALVLLAAGAPLRRGAESKDLAETQRVRVPVIPGRQPGAPARRIEAPQPGMKEEAEARRRAESRAQEAEQRLTLLQDQYRATLEELQSTQRSLREHPTGLDREFEERAVKAEAAARSLEQRLHSVTTERDRIAGELLARRDTIAGPTGEQLKQAEAEAMGLRAELEGAQTQLSMTIQEVASLQRQAERSRELQEELDAAQLESLHARDAMDTMQIDLRSARTELDDVRGELRALRNEEQRAAELTDELRSAKVELDSMRASHRAELVEREAELEEQVRSVREDFQAQVAEAEARHAADLAEMEKEFAARVAAAARGAEEASARVAAAGADLEAARSESEARAVDLESARAELQAAHDRIELLQQGLSERQGEFDGAAEEVQRARSDREALTTELADVRVALKETEAALAKERAEKDKLESSDSEAQNEARRATERAEVLAEELEAATLANTEMNRRLQEVESRRALEVAEDEGRAHMDELLTATQERLAGQSEKLIAAEERLREMDRQATSDAERLEELEAQLRQHQMAEQMRELQTPRHEHHEDDDTVVVEGLRAATPFLKEMSMDAQKTISRMMGVAQLLKHKHGAKEQAQLVQQLTANGRRLDNTIRDLSDIDSLVTGSVSLELRNTDLESLIRRVLEESGIQSEQDVRLEIEPVSIAVDRTRTEQIIQALLRSAGDRTPEGKTITVRLIRDKGGALIVVEDAESSAEISLSPMVRRLAEVQGGWAKVAPREGGGAAFQVFLPAGGPGGTPPPEPVEGDQAVEEIKDEPNHWVQAEQALVRELRELSQGKAK
jgi:signal transduction histidine kinase